MKPIAPAYALVVLWSSEACLSQEPAGIPVMQTIQFTNVDGKVCRGIMFLSDAVIPSNPDAALLSPRVQSDLDLMAEQKEQLTEELQEINSTFMAEYSELSKRGPTLRDSDEVAQKQAELSKKRTRQINELVKSVLLPHQEHRFWQLVNQSRVNESPESVGEAEIQDELHLTESQKSKLKEEFSKMQKSLAIELDRLRRKKTREVLESVLTEEQLGKLDGLMGVDAAERKED